MFNMMAGRISHLFLLMVLLTIGVVEGQEPGIAITIIIAARN